MPHMTISASLPIIALWNMSFCNVITHSVICNALNTQFLALLVY
uniref:Uncharacterized protein n=1 Tax=Arundo donax TaxID=35708 RepID=A0A0A8Y8J5_ARUDO